MGVKNHLGGLWKNIGGCLLKGIYLENFFWILPIFCLLKGGYIWKNFWKKLIYLVVIFLILIPIYCSHFSKIGRGVKNFLPEKMISLGGGGLFGNWIYRGYVKKFLPIKIESLGWKRYYWNTYWILKDRLLYWIYYYTRNKIWRILK